MPRGPEGSAEEEHQNGNRKPQLENEVGGGAAAEDRLEARKPSQLQGGADQEHRVPHEEQTPDFQCHTTQRQGRRQVQESGIRQDFRHERSF